MSKALTRLSLALLAAVLSACAAAAQVAPAQTPSTVGRKWVAVSPADEGFAARWPGQPTSSERRVSAAGIEASGRRYSAGGGGDTSYVVWSLSEAQSAGLRLSAAEVEGSGVSVESLYLDRVAEVAWELILAPELERLRRRMGIPRGTRELILETGRVGMFYARELEVSGKPAREYYVGLERRRGRVYICAVGARFYVVAALGPDAADPRLKFFNDTFALGSKPNTPAVEPGPVGNVGKLPEVGHVVKTDPSANAGDRLPVIRVDPSLIRVDPSLIKRDPPPQQGNVGGDDVPVDYNKAFKHNEVTRKALITFKPEPGFTEEARYFNVTGVVRLRAILAADGQIKQVSVVKPLPHGLTRKSLEAVMRIKFEPARLDGKAVSQYVVFEYNFNIY